MTYGICFWRIYILIRLGEGADEPNRNPDVFPEPAHTSSSLEGISLLACFPIVSLLPCRLKRCIRCGSWRRKYPLSCTQMLSQNERTPVQALKGFHVMSVFLLCLSAVYLCPLLSDYIHSCLVLFTFRLPCGLKRYIRCGSCRRKYPLFSESTFTQMLSLNECTPVLALKGFHFVICFVFLLCLANMTRDWVRSNCFVLLTFRLPRGFRKIHDMW